MLSRVHALSDEGSGKKICLYLLPLTDLRNLCQGTHRDAREKCRTFSKQDWENREDSSAAQAVRL